MKIFEIVYWISESEVSQSCPTLCYPVDCSPLGSSVHGIFQARLLDWVAISSPGDLPNPGIEPRSPALQADALTSEPPGTAKTYLMYKELRKRKQRNERTENEQQKKGRFKPQYISN